MNNFDEFFDKHKEEIIRYAKNQTKLNKDGLATISKSDDWFHDDVWDTLYEKEKDSNE